MWNFLFLSCPAQAWLPIENNFETVLLPLAQGVKVLISATLI